MAEFIFRFNLLGFQRALRIVRIGVAVATGDSAESFLGTQGYMWDTQSDMARALLGAVAALMILSKVHDRQLAMLEKRGRLSSAVVLDQL